MLEPRILFVLSLDAGLFFDFFFFNAAFLCVLRRSNAILISDCFILNIIGTIKSIQGKGADEFVGIEEDKTKAMYYWPVWPFPYGGTFFSLLFCVNILINCFRKGIRERPLEIGARVSFELKPDVPLRATKLLLEGKGVPPGAKGDKLIH
jgi:hypothetical protein